MGRLKRWLRREQGEEAEEAGDVTQIARRIGSMLDKGAMEIFSDYRSELLSRPITYIVPAVWGAMKESDPDETQREMNGRITPLVEEVYNALVCTGQDTSRRFALGYLIRGYLISKITYMIEASRNREDAAPSPSLSLEDDPDIGHA
jgi:hypothetical protein